MGLFDNIRGVLSNSKNSQSVQVNDEFEKARLAEKIVDSVNKIKKINTFDSSLWNLANVSRYDLMRKSLDELNKINSSLESRLSKLSRQDYTQTSNRETLEEARWTGQKPSHLNNYEFDRFQKDDDGR